MRGERLTLADDRAWSGYFPIDEYRDRWQKVNSEIERRGYAAALIWGRGGGTFDRAADVLYLTGYYSTSSGQGRDTKLQTARAFSSVLMRPGHEPELYADEPFPRSDLVAPPTVEWSFDPISAAGRALQNLGEERVALVGSDFLPVKYWKQLTSMLPGVEFVYEDDLVESIRRVKSPRELDCFREGGEIATRALTILMENLINGETEAEAAAMASAEVIRSGGALHMVPCSHGEMIKYFTANPLTGYLQEGAKPGELVRGWVYGPFWQGYYLDPGRTAVAGGKPSDGQKRLIETCVTVIDDLVSNIAPGKSILETARSAQAIVDGAGGEKDQSTEKFPLLGHGVGLFFEKPYIGVELSDEGDTFEAGMVLGVETFLALPGVGSAGFEQNLIVTEDGTELLTRTPMIWW